MINLIDRVKINKKGEFEINNECYESITFGYIYDRKKRTLFEDINSGKKEPICSSNNYIYPTGGTQKQAESCDKCPMSQWINKRPPACAEIKELILWNFDSSSPINLSVKRTSMNSWDKFLMKALISIAAKKTKINANPLFMIKGKIEISLEQSATGIEYFLPVFTVIDNNTKEEIDLLSNLADIMKKMSNENREKILNAGDVPNQNILNKPPENEPPF